MMKYLLQTIVWNPDTIKKIFGLPGYQLYDFKKY